jgi:hypothetical protein
VLSLFIACKKLYSALLDIGAAIYSLHQTHADNEKKHSTLDVISTEIHKIFKIQILAKLLSSTNFGTQPKIHEDIKSLLSLFAQKLI